MGGVYDCVSVRACRLPGRKLAGLCLFRWHSASYFIWRCIHSSRWKTKARKHAHHFISNSEFPLLVNLRLVSSNSWINYMGLSDLGHLIGKTIVSLMWLDEIGLRGVKKAGFRRSLKKGVCQYHMQLAKSPSPNQLLFLRCLALMRETFKKGWKVNCRRCRAASAFWAWYIFDD